MSSLSPDTPEENVAEEVAPEDRPDPEEYEVTTGRVSESTGTVYDPEGATEATPQDQRVVEEDDEE